MSDERYGRTRRGSLPYRTAFQTPLDYRSATEHVRGELRAWLRHKHLDLDRFDAGRVQLGPNTVLRYAATNDATGWQLREQKPNGVAWVSRITITQASRAADEEWVSIAVEAIAPPGVSAPDARTPHIARALLDGMQAHDQDAELRSYPVAISQARCEELLEIVCDPDRRLPVIVAAPPGGVDFDAWRRDVNGTMSELPGLASMYVLEPNVTDDFNGGIGTTHWIGPGSIRTYLPNLDPAIEADALRHRVLSHRRIDADPARARYLLAALPRQRAATTSIPTAKLALSGSDFARSAATVDDAQLVELRDEVKLVNELLSDASNEIRQLDAIVGRQQDEMMDVAHELEVAQKALEHSTSVARELRRRLIAAGQAAQAYAPVEQPQPLPTTFDDLLARLDELAPYVVYTGVPDQMLSLDGHPQNATWAQSAWQALRALHDYARVKVEHGFGGDFKTWCESPTDDCHTIPPGKVTRYESAAVTGTRKYAQPRTLPVPVSVDPTGKVLMHAHVRLGTDAQISPRMHYHDATSTAAAVFVGYIGPHLPNTQTN